jgi:ribonuclease P protein component
MYTPHPTLHVSVVVSKKIHKSAVKRNKLRRRIYDMVRRYRDATGISGVYIFVLKTDMVGKKFTDIQKEVVNCLQKLT